MKFIFEFVEKILLCPVYGKKNFAFIGLHANKQKSVYLSVFLNLAECKLNVNVKKVIRSLPSLHVVVHIFVKKQFFHKAKLAIMLWHLVCVQPLDTF